MLKKSISILLFLTSILSYAQNIHSITEFEKVGDSLIKTRLTEFDKSGSLLKDVNYGTYDSILKTFRNKVRTFEYKDGQRISEYLCENFASKDTCILRSFSTFEFNKDSSIEKQIKYETDSLIRFIKETKKQKRIKSSKTYSWEFFPVETPDYDKAVILKDTIFYDKKNRKIKRISYNSQMEKPVVELYDYSKRTYTYQTKGTYKDTILTFHYSKLQKLVDKNSLDYTFQHGKQFEYKIKYY